MTIMMSHVKVIPDAIQMQIYKNIEKELELLDNMDISKLVNKDKILEVTSWLNVSTPKQYDVFSNIDETMKKPKKLILIE